MMSRAVMIVILTALGSFIAWQWFGQGGSNRSMVSHSQVGEAAGATEPALRVVNVLDKELFDDAHIAGSICVPFENVEQQAASWDKSVPVVFYCANYQCSASGEAARMLQDMGFTQVYVYEGGTAEWFKLAQTDKSYRLEGPAQQGYLKNMGEPMVEESGALHVLTASELRDMMEAAASH